MTTYIATYVCFPKTTNIPTLAGFESSVPEAYAMPLYIVPNEPRLWFARTSFYIGRDFAIVKSLDGTKRTTNGSVSANE
jgi:hypothetical protein